MQRQELEQAVAGLDQQRVAQHHVEQRCRTRCPGEILGPELVGIAGVGPEPIDVVEARRRMIGLDAGLFRTRARHR